MQFGTNKHKYYLIFKARLTSLYTLQSLKIYKCLFIPNCTRIVILHLKIDCLHSLPMYILITYDRYRQHVESIFGISKTISKTFKSCTNFNNLWRIFSNLLIIFRTIQKSLQIFERNWVIFRVLKKIFGWYSLIFAWYQLPVSLLVFRKQLIILSYLQKTS